jgi:hypothetical protein
LLDWIAKSRLKRSGKLLEIARFGNLAQKGDFLGFSDSLLANVSGFILRKQIDGFRRLFSYVLAKFISPGI